MRVVNRHHLRTAWPAGAIYVGRPGTLARRILDEHPGCANGTALGNPFRPQDFSDPDDCLKQYRRWLRCRMNLKRATKSGLWVLVDGGDAAVMAALRSIDEDSVIVCSCRERPGEPFRPCHGQEKAKGRR
jgi:hypothetical protein